MPFPWRSRWGNGQSQLLQQRFFAGPHRSAVGGKDVVVAGQVEQAMEQIQDQFLPRCPAELPGGASSGFRADDNVSVQASRGLAWGG